MKLGRQGGQSHHWNPSSAAQVCVCAFLASMALGESQFLLCLGPDRWPVLRGANSSKIDIMLLSIWFTKPSTVGAGSENSVDNSIFCLKVSKFMFLISRYWYVLRGGLERIVLSLARTRQWSEISWEASTEVEETSFEGDGVMMRSSKENLSWCVSYLVGELPVVWRMWSGVVLPIHRHECLVLCRGDWNHHKSQDGWLRRSPRLWTECWTPQRKPIYWMKEGDKCSLVRCLWAWGWCLQFEAQKRNEVYCAILVEHLWCMSWWITARPPPLARSGPSLWRWRIRYPGGARPFWITGGSSGLTHVSVSAKMEMSLSAIRLCRSGALLTADLAFKTPRQGPVDDGPGLTSTPLMSSSSRTRRFDRDCQRQ